MAILNRVLDVLFRTLDAVDQARDRLDRVLKRDDRPEPWSTAWRAEPPVSPSPSAAPSSTPVANAPVVAEAPAAPKTQKVEKPKHGKPTGTTTKKPASKQAKRASGTSGGNRKGSVDRKGNDFDSPRARAIVDKLQATGGEVIDADATVDGKKVLARVLWALAAAEQAGSELGLTAADQSALLHLAAGLEVFATNVARCCRDETALIEESEPDGRSKRYRLTDEGRAKAAGLTTRPA